MSLHFCFFFSFVCHVRHHECAGKAGKSREQRIVYLIRLHIQKMLKKNLISLKNDIVI